MGHYLVLQIFLNQSFMGEPLPDTDATISLPPAIHDFLQPGGSRVQFQFYATDDLFQVQSRPQTTCEMTDKVDYLSVNGNNSNFPQDPRTANTTHSTLTLNSCVVSASVNDSHVNNLEDKVLVTFSHRAPAQV